MIVVDTSVWVAALRSKTSAEGTALRELLDADEVALPIVVRWELLSGAAQTSRRTLRRALSALPILYPTEETWPLIDGWVERAADRGDRFGVGDLLIGALAAEMGALLWSKDDDFDRMEKLGFLRRYQIPRP